MALIWFSVGFSFLDPEEVGVVGQGFRKWGGCTRKAMPKKQIQNKIPMNLQRLCRCMCKCAWFTPAKDFITTVCNVHLIHRFTTQKKQGKMKNQPNSTKMIVSSHIEDTNIANSTLHQTTFLRTNVQQLADHFLLCRVMAIPVPTNPATKRPSNPLWMPFQPKIANYWTSSSNPLWSAMLHSTVQSHLFHQGEQRRIWKSTVSGVLTISPLESEVPFR